MKGDFTRDTFDRTQHFSRVLMQQGRVTLDADHNEQTEILLHYIRTLVTDLLGPHAAPADGGGFVLSADENGDLVIGAGRIYVHGILVENDEDRRYTEQPDLPLVTEENDPFVADLNGGSNRTYWIYLDVWERHVTALEDDSIREKALGGPDTCTRTKVVWQVRAIDVVARYGDRREELEQRLAASTDPAERTEIQAEIDAIADRLKSVDERKFSAGSCEDPLSLLPAGDSALAARVDPGLTSDDACVMSPDSKYRGAENQLYRVEIHEGGDAATATFKWSRDNGSVATAWLGSFGNDVQVSSTRGFTAGNWVELTDDTRELSGRPGALVRVVRVGPGALTVESLAGADAFSSDLVNPRVRRWDEVTTGAITLVDGAVRVVETPGDAAADDVAWIDLEDGVQVRFREGGVYRTGDYWSIPARVSTGSVEWPVAANGEPAFEEPSGEVHAYAPLGFVWWVDRKLSVGGCRCEFSPLTVCASTAPVGGGGRLDTRRAVTTKDIAKARSVKKADAKKKEQ